MTAAEAARRAKALQDDQPRRQELVTRFKNNVGLMLTEVFKEAQQAAKEAGLELIEPTNIGLSTDILFERSFHAGPPRQTAAGRMPMAAPLVPHLEFRLMPDGTVQIRVPAIQSTPPAVAVRFSPHTLQLAAVTLGLVQTAFRDYLVAVKASLQAR